MLIIIGGLNECPIPKRIKLVAELKAIIDIYKVKFIVGAQDLDECLGELKASVISIGLPDIEVKKAIANSYGRSDEKLEPVLNMISTSLEVKIVGEIGSFSIAKISRFKLFELFVRKKLSGVEASALHLLSHIARNLSELISFSVSFRQLEMILKTQNISADLVELCIRSGLISKNMDKISFAHEMLLDFFVADSIVRFSQDSQAIIHEMQAPKNRDKMLLIIGSIEDMTILNDVLESIEDSKLLLSILNGDAGDFGKNWADNKLLQLVDRIEAEVKGLTLELTTDSYWPVQFKTTSLFEWTKQEWGFINSIPILFQKERLLHEAFNIVNLMDTVCDDAFKELLEEAKEKRVSLRSAIFSTVYVAIGNSRSALSSIYSVLDSGFATFYNKNEITIESLSKLLKRGPLKNGQLYLLLLLCKYDERAQQLYPFILDALKNKWRFIPYHLKNEILDRVANCYGSEDQRIALIECLNKIRQGSVAKIK